MGFNGINPTNPQLGSRCRNRSMRLRFRQRVVQLDQQRQPPMGSTQRLNDQWRHGTVWCSSGQLLCLCGGVVFGLEGFPNDPYIFEGLRLAPNGSGPTLWFFAGEENWFCFYVLWVVPTLLAFVPYSLPSSLFSDALPLLQTGLYGYLCDTSLTVR